MSGKFILPLLALGLLVFAVGHPGVLQNEIGDDVLDGQKQHPTDEQTDRDRRRHGRKRQADDLAKQPGTGRGRRRSAQLFFKTGHLDPY